MHESPHDAPSWTEERLVRLAAMDGVGVASIDMCDYGMRVDTVPVQGQARKRTKIVSNSNKVLKRIAVKCPNAGPHESQHHVHVPLEQGRAKRCQVYPQ